MILAKGTCSIPAMPLAVASGNEDFLVERVSGPNEQRLRLNEMGLVAGAPVSVVSRGCDGMVVVKVGGSRLALARGMADCIWVR